MRHALAGYVSYRLPAPFGRGAANALSRNRAVDAVFNGRSARPLSGFPFYRLDVGLRRQFNFGDEVNLQPRAEAFNLLNHPNFDDHVGALALLGATPATRLHTYFGRPLAAGGFGEWGARAGGFGPLCAPAGARTVNLSLKLTF